MDGRDDRRESTVAQIGAFYGRTQLKLGWTSTNRGAGAKRCQESGSNGWKAAKPLSSEPGAAAGFFASRIARRNPVIPAVANTLVLWDFDDGPLDMLAKQYALDQHLPADAWRVRTMDGVHLYRPRRLVVPGSRSR